MQVMESMKSPGKSCPYHTHKHAACLSTVQFTWSCNDLHTVFPLRLTLSQEQMSCPGIHLPRHLAPLNAVEPNVGRMNERTSE